MEKHEDRFIDAEEQGSYTTEGITFKDIVLSHLRRITSLASVEFRGGYWQTKARPAGNAILTEEIYTPDSRDVYCNAVDCLSDLCLPYFDDEMKEAEDDSISKLDTLKKEYINKEGEDIHNKFSNKKQAIKRELFRALNLFLFRKNYFANEYIED